MAESCFLFIISGMPHNKNVGTFHTTDNFDVFTWIIRKSHIFSVKVGPSLTPPTLTWRHQAHNLQDQTQQQRRGKASIRVNTNIAWANYTRWWVNHLERCQLGISFYPPLLDRVFNKSQLPITLMVKQFAPDFPPVYRCHVLGVARQQTGCIMGRGRYGECNKWQRFRYWR